MALPANHGRVNAWLDSQHPILGNSDLLDQVENPRTLPGASNLTKESLEGKGCRNLLVRHEKPDLEFQAMRTHILTYEPPASSSLGAFSSLDCNRNGRMVIKERDSQSFTGDEQCEEKTLQSSTGNKYSGEGPLADDPVTSHKLTRTEAWWLNLTTLDGPADFDFGFLPAKNKCNHINNTLFADRNSAPPRFNSISPMDGEQRHARLPAASSSSAHVEPLQVRKASSQTRLPRCQQSLNNNDSHQNISEKPVYPPRTSSIHRQLAYCDPATSRSHATRTKTPSPSLNSEEFSVAAGSPSIDVLYTASNTGYPTILSNKSRYLYPPILNNTLQHLSESSSAIMGDFVPINSPNMAGLQPDIGLNDGTLRAKFRPFGAPMISPYEFEPSTPKYDHTRQTTFTDFIKKGQEAPSPLTPRSAHVKNARSEDNAMRMATAFTHLTGTPIKSSGHPLYRSESSPNVSQLPFAPRRNATPSSDILQHYTEARETDSPARRGRQVSKEYTPPGGRNIGVQYGSISPSRQPDSAQEERPSRSPTQHALQASVSNGHATNRNVARSPTEILGNVSERDEFDDSLPHRSLNTGPSGTSTPSSSKKRSRSPMKKMFGENGWLGKSPDEKADLKLPSKRKVGMMEKLKNKFEEIAEKADLNPKGRARSNSDKHMRSVLAISLGPPEQARVYMEIELMLVHTANSFLMNQFSQGRMDIDSIKKTVEAWKNKGRPVVIEFMYDQATQRDLVVANQQSFRFHGSNAGNNIRISSMLYNWKQVANLMLIRTFCNADTVILKLLFDIEQILELLGAVEAMMTRLQQIRATATEIMRLARQNKDSMASFEKLSRGREPLRKSESSASSTLYNMNDPYGGMKLVPDSYKEY